MRVSERCDGTMKDRAKKRPTRRPQSAFADPAVEAVFSAYPKDLRTKLLALRRLILQTAAVTEGVGELQETLKWGQPSYLTADTRSGSTIRIDRVKADTSQYAMYVHCQTDLVATFRELYPKEFTFGGNRSIIFDADDDIPEPALRHCVALALTYHMNKRKSSRP
jgi:uncharacterized protein DUF1801